MVAWFYMTFRTGNHVLFRLVAIRFIEKQMSHSRETASMRGDRRMVASDAAHLGAQRSHLG